MTHLLKTQWPAVVASALVSAAITCAVLTIINNWDYIFYTLTR